MSLDSGHFKLLRDFEERFSQGPPSLVDCAQPRRSKGDVRFGRDVTVRGEVTVEGPRRVEDGEVLEG